MLLSSRKIIVTATLLLLVPLTTWGACKGDIAIPSNTDSHSCSGNSCLFNATFIGIEWVGQFDTRFFTETDLHRNDVTTSIAYTIFNASTSLSAPAQPITRGTSFNLPITWSGEVVAVGTGAYDSPPVSIEPSGVWQSDLTNIPLQYCTRALLAKEFTTAADACSSIQYKGTLLMRGQWTDAWQAFKADPTTGEYTVPTTADDISCSTSTDGLTANCVSGQNFSGLVKLELTRTLDNPMVGRDASHMVPVAADYDATIYNQYKKHLYAWCPSDNKHRHLTFSDPYPGAMVTSAIANIVPPTLCRPVLDPVGTPCVNPGPPAPTISWQTCGEDGGSYDVEFKRVADNVTQTVSVPFNQNTATIPDELITEDGNYAFRIRKVTNTLEGPWTSLKLIRIGKLATDPTVIAPTQVTANTNASVVWSYQLEDLLKKRLSNITFQRSDDNFTTREIAVKLLSYVYYWLPQSPPDVAYTINTYHPICGSSSVEGSFAVIPPGTPGSLPDIHLLTNGQDVDQVTLSPSDAAILTWYSNNTVGNLTASSNPASISWSGPRSRTSNIGEEVTGMSAGNTYILTLTGSGPGGTTSDAVAITISGTASPTPSASASPSISPTPSESITPTPSASASPSISPTPFESITPTPSASASPSISPTPQTSFNPGPIGEID